MTTFRMVSVVGDVQVAGPVAGDAVWVKRAAPLVARAASAIVVTAPVATTTFRMRAGGVGDVEVAGSVAGDAYGEVKRAAAPDPVDVAGPAQATGQEAETR